jgi:hypothetical protein
MALCLSRLPCTHVRFEPDVDGGTTYAFSFSRSDLVIGRERMFHLLWAIGTSVRSLESLSGAWVNPAAGPDGAYPDRFSFLADVIRLVNAGVLASREGEDAEQDARP